MKRFFTLACLMMAAILTTSAQTTPPETADTVDYLLTCLNVNPENENQYENLNEKIKVAFDGNDIYVQGLSAYSPTTWFKGTIDGDSVRFAKRQLAGSYSNTSLYMIGFDGKERDLAFYYNKETKAMNTDIYLLIIDGEDRTFQLMKNLMLTVDNGETPTPQPEELPDVVTPPANLNTTEYQFQATKLEQTQEGWSQEAVKWNVRLGFNGTDAYLQGVCPYMPEAWIKGKYDAGEGELTFASGQYYGAYMDAINLFFAGANYPTTNPSWADEVVFTFNKANNSYACGFTMITVNSKLKEMAPYVFFAGCKLVAIADKAATPAAPSIVNYLAYATNPKNPAEGYGIFSLDIPIVSVDGEALLTDKLSYRIYYELDGQRSPYTFRPAIYKNLTEEMSTIPYNFGDGFDIYLAGSGIYFYDDVKDATFVGAQTIYTGGGETKESEITWFDIKAAINGIDSAKETAVTPVSTIYTDLQGRLVNADAKGIILKTIRMSDGTKKTIKVVRK